MLYFNSENKLTIISALSDEGQDFSVKIAWCVYGIGGVGIGIMMEDSPAVQPLSRSVVVLKNIPIHINILSESSKLEKQNIFISFEPTVTNNTHNIFIDMKWLVKDDPLDNFCTCRCCKRTSVVIETT